MNDIFTLQSALQYGYDGRMEEWVHAFLNGAGHNPFLSYIISLQKRYFTIPVLYKLDAFTRNCGPENHMKYKVKKPGFEFIVGNMMVSLIKGWDMPPLIINYAKGIFDLSDGNHRYEALVKLGLPHYFVIFWTSNKEDFEKLQQLIVTESPVSYNFEEKVPDE